jgi:hypothetical protein
MPLITVWHFLYHKQLMEKNMKKHTLISFISLLFLLTLSSLDFAQETNSQVSTELASTPVIGKIYRKTQADSLYGPVLFSFEIPTAQLQSMLTKTNNLVMFKYDTNRFLVADNNRKVMNFSDAAVSADETMRVFSVSKVQELIKLGLGSVTKIEKRENVISLTNEAYTLEFGVTCPPYCN